MVWIVVVVSLCIAGALGCLVYGVVSLVRDRPRPLVVSATRQPRGWVLVHDDFGDDDAETTVASRYQSGGNPALIPTLVVRRHERPALVTIQEATTAVREVIAYRPTRRVAR